MRSNLWSAVRQLSVGQNRRRKLYITASVMGLIVAFSVFYLLMLPAITMEGTLACDAHEHVHDSSCYGAVTVCEINTESDAAAVNMATTLYMCDEEEALPHSHADDCYVLQLAAVCRFDETVGHAHGDECYTKNSYLSCDEEHDHEDICNSSESMLSCNEVEMASHSHEEACYAEEDALVCETDETAGHVHGDDCQAALSAMDTITGENGGDTVAPEHIHDDECYANVLTCDVVEHMHTDDCYVTEQVMLGIAPMSAEVEDGTSSLLKDFLDNVVIRDSQNVEITEGSSVYVGEAYTITLSFSEIIDEKNYRQFMYNGDRFLTYQLPDSISIIEPVNEQPIFYGETNRKIGAFSIDELGAVTVRFEDGLNEIGVPSGEYAGENYIYSFYTVFFDIELSATVADNGGSGEKIIDFGDGINIKVDVVKKGADLNVDKSYVIYDKSKHTLEYSVKIQAVSGTVYNLTMTDEIYFASSSSARLDKYSSEFSLEDITVIPMINKDGPYGQPSEGYPKGEVYITFTEIEDKPIYIINDKGEDVLDKTVGAFTVEFFDAGGAPLSLEPGEYVTLTYTIKIDDDSFKTGDKYGFIGSDGKYINANNTFIGNINNKAIANGTDKPEGGNSVTKSDDVVTAINVDLVDKSNGYIATPANPFRADIEKVVGVAAVMEYDDGALDKFFTTNKDTQFVRWGAKVGDGGIDIRGEIVTDAAAPELVYIKDIPILLTGWIIDATGKAERVGWKLLSWDDPSIKVGIDTDASGKHVGNWFKWTIPSYFQIVPGNDSVMYYELQYFTSLPENLKPERVTFANDFSIGDGYRIGPYEHGNVGVVGVGTLPEKCYPEKDFNYAVDPETGEVYFEYTITAAIIPEVKPGMKFYILDSMRIYPRVNGAEKEHNIDVLPFETVYELKDIDGNIIELKDYKPAQSRDGNNILFLFGQDELTGNVAAMKANSKWILPSGQYTLKITYRIDLDSPIFNYGKTIKQALDEDNVVRIRNEAYFYVGDHNKRIDAYSGILIEKEAKRAYWGMQWAPNGNWGWMIEDGGGIATFNEADYLKAEVKAIGYSISFRAGELNIAPLGETKKTPESIVFHDDFDDRLRYAPLSMKVTQYTAPLNNNNFGAAKNRYMSGGVDGPIPTGNNVWGPVNSKDGWNTPMPNTTSHVKVNGSSMTLDFADIDLQAPTHGEANYRKAIAVADSDWYKDTDGNYRIHYVLTFPDNIVPPDVNEYKNTATFTIVDANGNEASISDDATISFGNPVVDKEMTIADGGNIAEVEIVINPDAIDLDDESDLLQIDDIMTRLFMLGDSLKLEIKKDGAWVKEELTLTSEPGMYHYFTAPNEFNGENITLWIPDSTAVRITYQAVVMGKVGDKVDIANSVEIHGSKYSDEERKAEFVISTSSGAGGASAGGLTVYKIDATDGKYLPNAEFKLYTSNENLSKDKEDKVYITDLGRHFYYFETINTGDTGVIASKDKGAFVAGSTLWALVETQAPKGYMPLTVELVFYIAGSEDDVGEKALTIAQSVTLGKLYVENTPYHTRLPSTGGGGTAVFTVTGFILIGISAAVLLRRGRKKGGRTVF